MCCQQMTPLDLPVLLLHQCQNKSLHQLGSLGALHLRARTSFFGRCLWSANHVVWAAVKPACMEAPCPCISVLCPCHMPLHLHAPCPSIPRSLCPCPTARLGFQGSRRSWAPPGGRPRPRSLGEVRQGPPTGLVLGWLRGAQPCMPAVGWLASLSGSQLGAAMGVPKAQVFVWSHSMQSAAEALFLKALVFQGCPSWQQQRAWSSRLSPLINCWGSALFPVTSWE